MIETFKRWRGLIANVVTVVILGLVIYWGWQNRTLVMQVIGDLGYVNMAVAILWEILVSVFSLLAFTLLVRGFGYRFSLRDGYICLYLSQIAAMLPGAVWGYVGLGGLLWAHGISKRDVVFIISSNLILGIGMCGLFGLSAWAIAANPWFLFSGLLWLVILLGARALPKRWSDRLMLGGKLAVCTFVRVAGVNFLACAIEAACFVWLFSNAFTTVNVSPWFIASAYALGYLAGFIAVFAPAGLGVREALIALLLGPSVGVDQVLVVAMTFRLIQSLAQWANVAGALFLRSRRQVTGLGE